MYEAEGVEVEIDPAALPYLRVLTSTRALLFGFVVCAVRSLALTGAFEVAFRGESMETRDIVKGIDAELDRLTGGLFRFPA